MNFPIIKYLIASFALILITSCGDDEEIMMPPVIDPPSVNFAMNQTVQIASTVSIDGSASSGEGALSYEWTVIDPSGTDVALADRTASMISFDANLEGDYMISLRVSNTGGASTESGTVTVLNPTFTTADQMGRPAINTVFNFFGDAATKNAYNQTFPEGSNVDPVLFKGILDALQGYIGLDASTYVNVLGLDNATTASVLATDVLMSNKNFSSTYGPSDLNDLRLGENLLNGRGLNDDVVDVTLILAFAGDLTNLSPLQMGLIGDNVSGNDQMHSNEFPYVANPH